MPWRLFIRARSVCRLSGERSPPIRAHHPNALILPSGQAGAPQCHMPAAGNRGRHVQPNRYRGATTWPHKGVAPTAAHWKEIGAAARSTVNQP
jgi:hypothetical protein